MQSVLTNYLKIKMFEYLVSKEEEHTDSEEQQDNNLEVIKVQVQR